MSDFIPPTGPPPPKVPEGWKVQWNDQYSEWFYVNIYTKKSQWDKPTEPVYPPNDEAPSGAPPGYAPNGGSSVGGVGLTNTTQGQTDQKNNPYDPKPNTEDADEELARRLQAEEDARSQGTRGAQQDYMNTPMGYQNSGSSPYPQQQQQGGQYPPQPNYAQQGQQSYPEQLPPREQKKSGGFLGKLLAKASSSGKPQGGYGQQQGGYGQQQYPQQYPGGGGYGQQGMMGGGYGQQHGMMGGRGYGQPMMGGGGYGRPQKKPGGGMGMAGGAALGLGGGLIGGAMLANAFDDDNDDYREGYQDGQQDDGDYGGGDDGGGGDD